MRINEIETNQPKKLQNSPLERSEKDRVLPRRNSGEGSRRNSGFKASYILFLVELFQELKQCFLPLHK